MLYSDKYANFNECETYQHARYKPNNEYRVTQFTKLKYPNFHTIVNTYVNELNVIMSTSRHKKKWMKMIRMILNSMKKMMLDMIIKKMKRKILIKRC
jgi:hypothetical protein